MHLNPKIIRDPQFNLSRKDQRLLMRRATRQWLKKPFNIFLYVLVLVAWMVIMIFVPRWLESQGLSSAAATITQWFVLYPLMFASLFYLFYRFRLLQHIYKELRDLGHDICPTCGYTLINLPESETNCPAKCPECGTARSALPPKTKTD